MSYIPAAWAAQWVYFSRSVRRKVIVMHKTFLARELHTLHKFLVSRSAKGEYGKRLGLSPQEQPCSVGAGQNPCLSSKLAYLIQLSVIYPPAFHKGCLVYGLVHRFFKKVLCIPAFVFGGVFLLQEQKKL